MMKRMSRPAVPHYVKFARSIALVAIALPLPAVVVLEGCSSDATSGPYLGNSVPTDAAGGGVRVAADSGSMPAPEAGSGGVQVAPDSGSDDASSFDDASSSDAADDGGGPHRGTPEVPASFFA
jgi:hypothetical protein